jgi:hypothetical protein
LGTIGVWLGNIRSGFLRNDKNFHLNTVTLAMTCLAFVVVFAIYDIPGNGFWVRLRVFLIADVALLRFGYGYVTPLIYRDIAREMPDVSEEAARFVGFWSQVVSIIIKLATFILTINIIK